MLRRDDKTAAHVGPFVAFMLLMLLVGWVKHDNPNNPWWQQAPAHWVYPLQTLVALGLIAWWWRNYEFRPANLRALLIGAAVGAVGLVLWVLPSVLYDRWHVASWGWPKWATDSLGLAPRAEDGFDPYLFPEGSPAFWTTITLRLVRMTVAVPILEELLWRGFLWRYLAADDRPFWQMPFGVRNPKAIGISILLFTSAHHQTDWLGCIIYGISISWVALKTKSLAACIVCHAVTNLLLGIYILKTGQWGFW